jgi:hypothetical protein
MSVGLAVREESTRSMKPSLSIGKPKTLLPRGSEPARVNSLQLMRYWGPLPV